MIESRSCSPTPQDPGARPRVLRRRLPRAEFVPGESSISYAGRVFDDREIVNLVDSGLDFWLTTGRFADEFEKSFAKFFGRRHAHLVNSGSSANLLALSTLTAPQLDERARKWGGAGGPQARGRGDHRGRRIPHHAQPHHPEPPGAGLRRRHGAHLQHRRLASSRTR